MAANINRIDKIKSQLKEKAEKSAIIITSPHNRRYLTNITTSSGTVIITPENAYFFTDFRYIEFAKKSLSDCFTVELYPGQEPKKYYNDLLKKEDVKELLFEEDTISLQGKRNLDNTYDEFKLVESGGMVEKLRQTKDETEIANIAKAQSITDSAFSYILEMIADNINTITETDIAVELEYFMKKNGADDKAFDTICVSGEKSAYPHGEPGNVKLSKGFLTMDFGARYDGYCSDMTRTICIGKADAKMLEVYNTVKSAQLAALDLLKAGIETWVPDTAARNIIGGAGYGECFGHGLGHSVGLQIHESPGFGKEPKEELKVKDGEVKTQEEVAKEKAEKEKKKLYFDENIVITVEPGIYIENMYGVRIEDMAVIKKDGHINLTKSDKNLIEL